MKKNNIKPLIMSALTALAMGAVGTVGTFALFTDKAETEISIGSGTVKIGTVATLVKYQSSVDGTNQDLTGETSYVNTLVGSSFGLDGNTINISKMVPGDKLTLRVVSRNESDIKTKIRYVISHAKVGTKKDLFPALKVNFEPENNATVADLFRWTQHDAAPSGGEEIHSTLVTVEFPNHGFEITSRDKGIDNQYQDAACSISFALEAVQANAALDPIEEINAYLKAELFFEGHNDTMHDAVIDMAEIGYTSLSVLDGYVYEYAEDRFVAADSVTSDYHKYFKAVSNQTAAGNFSIYAANDWSDATVSLSGIGFDAGNASGIEQVNYIRTGVLDEKDVLIRTNSLDTSVTINAPNDVVTHYGEAQQVSIIAVKGSSYHEYGKVLFVDVSTGRIALEATSEVERVHFNVQDDKKTFENIVVAYDESLNALPEFSRDAVSEIKDEGTLVVELQKGTEVTEQTEKDYVYLYQQGLKEQIRVTSQQNATAEQVAQAPVSTDASVAPKTKTAAEQISNSITGGSYTAEQIAAGEVDVDDVTDNGLDAETAEEKQEIIQSIIEDRLSEIAVESSTTEHRYVARIGSQFYESFYDAFYAVNGNGKTIRVIDNEADVSFVRGFNYKFYLNSGTEPVRDENNKYISLPYSDLTIHVEEGVTLDLGAAQNGRIIFNGTSGSLRLEGAGNYAFDGDSQNSLVNISNSHENIRVYTAGATFTSRNTKGYLANGKLNIVSGTYSNIGFSTTPEAINGGAFSNTDFENYLPDGKMAVLSGDYYVIGSLTADGAKFRVDNPNMESLYFRTLGYKDGAFSSAQAGATITFLDDYHQEGAIGHLDNNITIDLNSHTLDSLGGNPALPISEGYTVTVKNGYLDVLYLISDMDAYTIIGDNLRLNIADEKYLDHIQGVYVRNDASTFTIQANAPANYDARVKINAESEERDDFYFNCEHAVAEAIKLANPGSTVWANVSESDTALASNLHISDTITIIKDSSVEFPEFNGADGKGKVKTQIDENTAVFEIKESYAFRVGEQSYYKADQFVAAWSAWTSTSGQTFQLQEDFEYNAQPAVIAASITNMVLDLNGHKLTFSGLASNSGFMKTNGSNRSCSLTINGNGGTIISSGCLVSNAGQKTSKIDLTVNGGTYICSGPFSQQNNQKATITFNSGTFVSSNSGGYYYNPKYIVTAGTCFGENSFAENKALRFCDTLSPSNLKRGNKLDVDKILNQDIYETVAA